MSRFDLITFDCYGTLIDWEKGMKNALKELAERRKISMNIENMPERYINIELEVEQERYRKYREVLTLAAKRLLAEQGVELVQNEEKILVDTLPTWPPFPETIEVLRNLKDKQYKLAILSNIDEDLIKYSVDLIGVEFDGVITAEQTKSYKPSHGHWERMLEIFGMPKHRVLHVAASYVHDIIPAKEMGFKAAWINRKSEKITGTVRPDHEFHDLRPLANIL